MARTRASGSPAAVATPPSARANSRAEAPSGCTAAITGRPAAKYEVSLLGSDMSMTVGRSDRMRTSAAARTSASWSSGTNGRNSTSGRSAAAVSNDASAGCRRPSARTGCRRRRSGRPRSVQHLLQALLQAHVPGVQDDPRVGSQPSDRRTVSRSIVAGRRWLQFGSSWMRSGRTPSEARPGRKASATGATTVARDIAHRLEAARQASDGTATRDPALRRGLAHQVLDDNAVGRSGSEPRKSGNHAATQAGCHTDDDVRPRLESAERGVQEERPFVQRTTGRRLPGRHEVRPTEDPDTVRKSPSRAIDRDTPGRPARPGSGACRSARSRRDPWRPDARRGPSNTARSRSPRASS